METDNKECELKIVDVKENRECRRLVRELYLKAFPREERAPYWFLQRLSRKEGADFYGIYEGEQFDGLVYLIHDEKLVYILFLAVNPMLRGQGYGSRILSLIKKLYPGKKLLLAIEPVVENCDNYQERVNRLAFYRKNGFREMDFIIRELRMRYQALGYTMDGQTIKRQEYLSLLQKRLGRIVADWLDRE